MGFEGENVNEGASVGEGETVGHLSSSAMTSSSSSSLAVLKVSKSGIVPCKKFLPELL